jgi:prepilin-type N-terminal cleavage/methylation domain-containing protein
MSAPAPHVEVLMLASLTDENKIAPLKRRGFTLTELAIVMGVIGAIVGAIWWVAGNAKEMQRDNDAVQELQSTVQGVLDLMTGQSFPVAADTNYTSNMITAQAIPAAYINLATPTTADNPWSPSNFVFVANPNRTFRVAFYGVSQRGCLALLLQETACQAGQMGCPTEVYTGGKPGGTWTSPKCVPGKCNGTVNSNLGWQVLTATAANTLCSTTYNSYAGGINNSVEFMFSL